MLTCHILSALDSNSFAAVLNKNWKNFVKFMQAQISHWAEHFGFPMNEYKQYKRYGNAQITHLLERAPPSN